MNEAEEGGVSDVTGCIVLLRSLVKTSFRSCPLTVLISGVRDAQAVAVARLDTVPLVALLSYRHTTSTTGRRKSDYSIEFAVQFRMNQSNTDQGAVPTQLTNSQRFSRVTLDNCYVILKIILLVYV